MAYPYYPYQHGAWDAEAQAAQGGYNAAQPPPPPPPPPPGTLHTGLPTPLTPDPLPGVRTWPNFLYAWHVNFSLGLEARRPSSAFDGDVSATPPPPLPPDPILSYPEPPCSPRIRRHFSVHTSYASFERARPPSTTTILSGHATDTVRGWVPTLHPPDADLTFPLLSFLSESPTRLLDEDLFPP